MRAPRRRRVALRRPHDRPRRRRAGPARPSPPTTARRARPPLAARVRFPRSTICRRATPAKPFLVWACRCAVRRRGRRRPRRTGCASEADAAASSAGAAAGQRAVSLGVAGLPGRPERRFPTRRRCCGCAGSSAALHAPRVVAVVGARAASRQGLEIAAAIGGELAAAGVVVVSGLARGIDTAAHRAALDAGGLQRRACSGRDSTGSIRPSTRGWPTRSPSAARWSASARPGAPPLPHHFPLRNRIISGLRRGHRRRRGVREERLAHHRRGGARPGPRGDGRARARWPPGRHRGAHALLRDGATLVERADDVMAALGWATPAAGGRPAAAARSRRWPPNSASIRRPTSSTPTTCAAATGWPAARVCARLGALEIAGAIQRVGGGRFVGSRNRVLT